MTLHPIGIMDGREDQSGFGRLGEIAQKLLEGLIGALIAIR